MIRPDQVLRATYTNIIYICNVSAVVPVTALQHDQTKFFLVSVGVLGYWIVGVLY